MLQTKSLTIKKVLPLFIIFTALVATSYGTFTPPEPGWRGNEGSTYQCWEFSTSANPILQPDVSDNPFGTAGLQVTPHPDNQNPWYNDEIPGAVGIWSLSGEIDISIPNDPEPRPYKEMWITLRWRSNPDDETGEDWPQGIPAPPNNDFLPYKPVIGVMPKEAFDYMDMYMLPEIEEADGWKISTYVVGIWPNPTHEWITIKGNILVDAVSVDTICIPEPATIAVLSIGGFLAVRRRKNRG